MLRNHKKQQIIGETFGNLTVLDKGKDRPRGDCKGFRPYWLCKCHCNKIIEVKETRLLSGATKSCGCLQSETAKEHIIDLNKSRRIHDEQSVNFQFVYNEYAKRGLRNISIMEFYDLTQMSCHYCGQAPSNIRSCRAENYPFIYNGLDRIDSSIKGYDKFNINTSCKDCNFVKKGTSIDKFYEMIYHINILIDNKPLDYKELHKQNNNIKLPNMNNYRLNHHIERYYFDINFNTDLLHFIMTLNCFYCGQPPSNTCMNKRSNSIMCIYNGLDRIDQKLPHHLNNIVPSCKLCNWSKMEWSCSEFKSWAKRAYIHLNSQDILPNL